MDLSGFCKRISMKQQQLNQECKKGELSYTERQGDPMKTTRKTKQKTGV